MPVAGAVVRSWPLLAVALLSAALNWLEFYLRYPLAEWWQHARLDYAWLDHYELANQARFLGSFALLFGLYLWAWRYLRRNPSGGSLGCVLLGQLLIAVPLIGIYPVTALDLFDYLLYGRLAMYHGANPLAEAPSRYPSEPLVAYSYWPDERSVYGPLWQIASEMVTALTDGRLPDGLVGFKLLALASALVTTALIWMSLRWMAPSQALSGALLYGWNPLQQFESAGNGHNDALMVALLAAGLLALVRGWRLLVLPSLTLGLLVKITLAPLVPVVALAVALPVGRSGWRWRSLCVGSGLSVILAAWLFAPFWQGRQSLAFLDRGNWFTASPATLLRELLRSWQPFEAAGRTAALIAAALFGTIALSLMVHLVRHWPGRQRPTLAIVRASYQTFFAYLIVGCLWWQPWYLLVLLLLAALSADRLLADRANLFCIGGLLSYPVFKYVWSVHQADWGLDYTRIMALSVIAIFTLPLVHLAICNVVGAFGNRAATVTGP